MDFDRKGLLDHICKQFPLDLKGEHGPSHWARVKHHGMRIGDLRGADLMVIELFSFIHDSGRTNEHYDPEHPKRGAANARAWNGKFYQISQEQEDLLAEAILGHSDGHIHEDVTIQSCWDGDRLDLGRVGKKPLPQYLSNVGASFIEEAYEMSIRWAISR